MDKDNLIGFNPDINSEAEIVPNIPEIPSQTLSREGRARWLPKLPKPLITLLTLGAATLAVACSPVSAQENNGNIQVLTGGASAMAPEIKLAQNPPPAEPPPTTNNRVETQNPNLKLYKSLPGTTPYYETYYPADMEVADKTKTFSEPNTFVGKKINGIETLMSVTTVNYQGPKTLENMLKKYQEYMKTMGNIYKEISTNNCDINGISTKTVTWERPNAGKSPDGRSSTAIKEDTLLIADGNMWIIGSSAESTIAEQRRPLVEEAKRSFTTTRTNR